MRKQVLITPPQAHTCSLLKIEDSEIIEMSEKCFRVLQLKFTMRTQKTDEVRKSIQNLDKKLRTVDKMVRKM